jgi:hypothetical protein
MRWVNLVRHVDGTDLARVPSKCEEKVDLCATCVVRDEGVKVGRRGPGCARPSCRGTLRNIDLIKCLLCISGRDSAMVD